jgi:DNA-directed RNA polymerase subunit L
MSHGKTGGQVDKERAKLETDIDTGNTFQLHDEDHTLANALRYMLNKK